MDTPQPPNQTLKRKERSPSPTRRTPGHTSTAGSRPSPTSLPSIRHFLPPQPDTAQLNERYHPNNRQQTGPAFSAGPSAGIPRLEFLPPPPARPPAERTHSGIIGDSDGDGDSEQAARPKQKRRRQALSCTECKRRKIKCDRAHPCTPCIRRGDQNKCQWHVIEPVDKYVSRAEYDELKARVDHLETLLLSRPHGFTPQPQQGPEPTSSSQPKPKPVGLPSSRLPAVAAPGQQQGCGAISTAPVPVPMPIMPYDPIGLPPPNSSPVGRTSLTTTTATTTLTSLPSIASLANGPPPHPTGGARLHREHHDHEHREQQHQPYAPLPPPQSPLQQQQSLQLQLQLQQLRVQRLYKDKQQQTKNCHAQTFTPLGERLRCHRRIFLQGPADVNRLYRLPNNNSNNSDIHRRLRRILVCGVRRGRRTRVTTCHGRPHPERQCSEVQSVRRSENGSRVLVYPWLWTRRNCALRW